MADAALPRAPRSLHWAPLALGAAGFVLFLGAWSLLVHFDVWRFGKLPDPAAVVREWTSRSPEYGISLFTAAYYQDIWASTARVFIAFGLATLFGVPLGLLLGWNRVARDFLFPLLELIRPIPPLAWVPLAILMLSGQGAAMIFLTWIAAFFATVLNTMLGVTSIDDAYIRAAYCLGSRRRDVLWNVVLPGALPYIFTGLQIGMGVAWFSLVAGEMIAGEAGLGYLILNAYTELQTVTIVIGMVTLGAVGFASSALARAMDRRKADAVASTLRAVPSAARGGSIALRGVGKLYDPAGHAVVAVEDWTLDIAAGEFVAVVGPSGCGKTTLLNSIAGFEPITAGRIELDGQTIASPARSKRPGADRIVVFQNGSLFPWKTVTDNVAYGPIVQGRLTRSAAREEALAMLARLRLADVADAYPGKLSSGVQRRVEMARALISNPKVLLLDEPFRALDAIARGVMHEVLLELYDATHKTVFFITHDLDEAIFLADRVVVSTSRPARVKCMLPVDLPRPRSYRMMASPEFLRLKRQVADAVHEEAEKAFRLGEREAV